jgi:hypothetical protein
MLPNGLYAVEMKTLDGVNAVATGVAVARDGVVMGGDPYFYYTGTDSCKNGRIKGELVNKQHTPYHGTAQLFYAGREVGLGFSGTYEGDRADMYGVLNVGRRSVSVHLKIRKLADVWFGFPASRRTNAASAQVVFGCGFLIWDLSNGLLDPLREDEIDPPETAAGARPAPPKRMPKIPE